MKATYFKWGNMSRRQKMVLSWWTDKSPYKDYDGIIADGAIRSGKTVCMAFSFVIWAMTTFNRQNLGMCGKTIESFRRNVLGTLKRQLKARGYTVTEKRSENLLVVSKGEKANLFYIFGGKDESSQDLIQGITLAGVFFDEVALMPESFVNQATARCSVDGSKFWFNCNPEGPQHWFYILWILKCKIRKLLYLHFTMDDNLTLTEKIKERYRMLYTGVFFKRFILGLWVVAEGLVYDFGEENTTDEVPEVGEYYLSIDYGTMNPFSCGLWCVSGMKAVRINEYYYSGRGEQKMKTDEDYCDEVERLCKGYNIESVIIDPSAASMIAALRKRGFKVKKANNDVMDGIRRTAVFLKSGKVLIHRNCKDAIKEFGLYRWDEKSTTDKVIKDNDHAMDEIRYFCNTILRHKFKESNDAPPTWMMGR